MVWETGRLITTATVVLRLISALIPVGQLCIGKLIIDQVVGGLIGHIPPDLHRIWVLLAYEVALAS